jgi:hypothetical protein
MDRSGVLGHGFLQLRDLFRDDGIRFGLFGRLGGECRYGGGRYLGDIGGYGFDKREDMRCHQFSCTKNIVLR